MNWKERMVTGWNFSRVLYVVTGTLFIVQSAMQGEWFGILFGGYFASMGVFAFGCASGCCGTQNTDQETGQNSRPEIGDIHFEEVKTK